MSMYLFDDSPIVINTTLANEIGLNEVIVLKQINYWIEINKKAGKNYYDILKLLVDVLMQKTGEVLTNQTPIKME